MNFFPIYSSPRRQQRLWCVIFFHPQNPSGVLQKEKKFPPLAIQRKHTAAVYANVIKPRKKNIECLHTGHVVTWNRKCHENLHQHSGAACTIPLNDPLFLFFFGCIKRLLLAARSFVTPKPFLCLARRVPLWSRAQNAKCVERGGRDSALRARYQTRSHDGKTVNPAEMS